MYNIAFVNSTALIGGAERSLLGILEYIDKTTFSCYLFLPEEGPLAKKAREFGAEVNIVALKRLRWRNPFPFIKTIYELYVLFNKFGINLVVSNIEFANQYSALAAKILGLPVVCHIRNIQIKINRFEYLLALPKLLIANSLATANSIGAINKIKIVYNGVDVNKYNSYKINLLRNEKGLSYNNYIVGMVGRITPEKGQHIFIEAFAKALIKNARLHAFIIGDTSIDNSGTYLEKLKLQTGKLNIADKIHFISYIDDLSRIYDSLDLVVVPSVAEPFGRVIIEAMAFRKPVIATRAGGAVEIIIDGMTGYLVPVNDAEAISMKITELSTNAEISINMGLLGRKRVEEVFTIKKNVAETVNIYKEVLDQIERV